jgi:tetratricopeptide (TPR) repeat protein
MRYVLFLSFLTLFACADHTRESYDIPVGQKQNEENQHLAALSILSDAIKNNPSEPDNYYKRAVLQYKLENYKDALVDITRAERLNPNSGLFLFQKAKIQNILNDKGALKNALDAESQQFSSPALYVLIADLYLKEKNFKMAQQYMQKAESLYPYNSELFLAKGKYYAMQNDTATAVNNYKRALVLKPHSFEPYDHLIKIFNSARLVDSALTYNEKALKKFPKNHELVYNKAQTLENVGALDSATKVYQSFLRLEPARYDVLEKVGDIFLRKKNYAAAFLIYDKWGKAVPDNEKAYLKASACYEYQKRYSTAKSYLEGAIEKMPESKGLVERLSTVNYLLEAQSNAYTEAATQTYSSFRRKKQEEAEQPEPQRRIFDIGNIEKIQKRSQISIGKDTTRN